MKKGLEFVQPQAQHRTSVRLMLPSTLIKKIQKLSNHDDRTAVSPERDITLVNQSYAKMVQHHKQNHEANKQTGVYGILPPLSQQRRERKSLANLRAKTANTRWSSSNTRVIGSSHGRRRSLDQMSHHAKANMLPTVN